MSQDDTYALTGCYQGAAAAEAPTAALFGSSSSGTVGGESPLFGGVAPPTQPAPPPTGPPSLPDTGV